MLAVRDARPQCGKRRIHHELKRRKNGCAVSVSTVGRILWSLYAGDLTVEAVNAELDEYLRFYNDEDPTPASA